MNDNEKVDEDWVFAALGVFAIVFIVVVVMLLVLPIMEGRW